MRSLTELLNNNMSDTYTNFPEFFQFITSFYKDKPFLYWRKNGNSQNESDSYESLNGSKFKELVYLLARSLEKFGLEKSDNAAIISESRSEWVITDFACISKGLVTVPVYTTMTSEQIKFILSHSGSRLCFVSTKLLAEKVNAVFDELPKLKKIITFNKFETGHDHIMSFEELLYGEIISEHEPYGEELADNFFAKCSANCSATDPLTIIYTSGTTGTPKGVLLTHGNVLSNIKQCTDSFPVLPEDRFLSFLPLAHTYERTGGYYVPLSKGAAIYYAQSIDTLSAQMAEVKPTILLSVPILFSRVRSRIMKNIESLPLLKRLAARQAFTIGKKYREKKDHFLWKLADKKVFREIREKTGGNIKFFISGGSALNKDIAEFFDSIGLLILEGYGMTEASPVISVNRIDNYKFGTVGLPLAGVEVKTAEDSEILVRGDNVMPGYYHNESETREMIIDGWLHTGDIGEIDKDGFLKITDRKKSLIKTASGKYISLTHIEETLETSEFIEQIIVFASDEKHFVTALIVPDFEKLEEFAKKVDVKYESIGQLVENDVINNFFESEIDVLQKHLAKYERVRKFALLERPFTIESGELTPTLKLKRKVIEEKHRELIDRFYE